MSATLFWIAIGFALWLLGLHGLLTCAMRCGASLRST